MLTAIENEIPGELVPEFIGVKRGGRTQKSVLAARREGLLETVDGRMRPTVQGRRFLNRLLAGFLP